MKYLVTGGAGFIGSHIVEELLRRGHEVVVVDNLASGRRDNLDAARRDAGASAARLRFLQTDLLELEAWAEQLAGVSAVFHQAAIASVPRSFADPAETVRVNIEGTARLLEACRRRNVRRVVLASSTAVYGDALALPTPEDTHPAPLSPYATSKLAGEQLLAMWVQEFGLQAVPLRYFNVFGARQDPASDYAAVIPKFITRMVSGRPPRIFGDGRQSRDFVHVEDVVAANLAAAGVTGEPKEAAWGRPINVGCGRSATLLDLVAALNDVLGTDLQPEFAPPRPGDVRASMASIERARELLGYEPRVSFREGLARTVAWYAEQMAARATA